MAVPKKRTSISKKHIRKNIWKKKGYWAALKALSLSNSINGPGSNFSNLYKGFVYEVHENSAQPFIKKKKLKFE
uniref:ribosomal protein L32 n=1 Tax=Melocactus glaucescens TaxID=2775423 RepID=UPI00286B4D36|nr:ribosomal protein L32 [Melocactus glaucescens]WKK45489.1 ribosomal protein L32 [Melocactus glaucescens]